MKNVTRRECLRLLGLATGAIVIQACGGSGQAAAPDPGNFVAGRDGSVLDVTSDVFGVTTQYKKSVDDFQVTYISYRDQPLLSGDNLVFEINNSGELIGGGVSAMHTQVQQGDHIHWRSLA